MRGGFDMFRAICLVEKGNWEPPREERVGGIAEN